MLLVLQRAPLELVVSESELDADPGTCRGRHRDGRAEKRAGVSARDVHRGVDAELAGGTVGTAARDTKITVDHEAVDLQFVDVFPQASLTPPAAIIRDLDATDDPGRGVRDRRFFHADYGHDCYLPLSICAGEHLRCARLRPSDRVVILSCPRFRGHAAQRLQLRTPPGSSSPV